MAEKTKDFYELFFASMAMLALLGTSLSSSVLLQTIMIAIMAAAVFGLNFFLAYREAQFHKTAAAFIGGNMCLIVVAYSVRHNILQF